MALFFVLAFAAYAVLGSLHFFNEFAAGSSAWLLGLSGKAASVDYGAANPFVVFGNVRAEIGGYCSASVELAVLFGIVLASTDRSLRSRITGFLAGAALILAFNALRIFVVLYFFSYSAPVLSSLFHDILFRASIVVFLATYYAAWYYSGEKAG